MELRKEQKKHISKGVLALCNVILMLAAVLVTVVYSNRMKTTQEQLMRGSFCNMVETMKQISENYLSAELADAENWIAYIEREHMTMDDAMDYIRTVSDQEKCEAHFVDMDTLEAWSTREAKGSNEIHTYSRYLESDAANIVETVARIRRIYDGEKLVLSKYRVRESQRNVIAVGGRVTLRQEDGTDRDYLLLRVIQTDHMRDLWLFPVNYASAEIGMVATNGDYVIPSKSMRGENWAEFLRAYNFEDDYNGVDALIPRLEAQEQGLWELNDSRGEPCLWYFSRLETFEGVDILGYIPVKDLSGDGSSVSIVVAVAGILLMLILLDGAYILRINRQLRQAAEIAKKASNAKTEFLSSMSHDIRTPLNAVLGMTELAQSHVNDTNYVKECLRKISLSGNHLLTLINDILDISRVESGRTVLNPVPFDVRDMVSGLEIITRSQAVGHGLQLDVSFGNLPEPWLMGDKLRLTQIYLNLLNNAVKYTKPGGNIRLKVWEDRAEGTRLWLTCVVADTGVGMSPEFQKNMYESFTRVQDSRINKIQGSGLGLAIVKRMVDLMDGTIDCRSAEGAGTTFTVRIPLEAVAAPASPEGLTETGNHSEELKNVRILVAEDNDINWEIISEMLESYGIRCSRAANGRECVDMLTAAPPGSYDLVFMDVQMPVLNGRDAARELRACNREDLRTIPIAAMTADAFAEDVQLCLDAGMDAHVAKPIEIEKVLATIRLLLSRRNSPDRR